MQLLMLVFGGVSMAEIVISSTFHDQYFPSAAQNQFAGTMWYLLHYGVIALCTDISPLPFC